MIKTSTSVCLARWIGRLLGYEREVQELQRSIRELQWDATFGMWTRTAFLQLCRVMPRGRRVVGFLDLDDIHDLNHAVGYTEVDRRIRDTFSIQLRSSDVVARWYSGDEIVILFDSDESGARMKIGELERSAHRHALGFVWELGTWDVGRQDVVDVINALADRSRAKQKAQRGVLHGARSRG